MFRKLSVVLAVLFLLIPRLAVSQDSSLLVSDLLKQIQRGLNTAKTTIDADYKNVPPLDSVTLQLQTETATNGTGGINLWFVKIGGGGGKTSSSQMTLVLKPATVRGPVSYENLDQTISQALIGAAKGLNDAQSGADGIPLLLDSLSADFAFTVTKKMSGGLVFNLMPIGGSGSLDRTQNSVHKITVKFAKVTDAKTK